MTSHRLQYELEVPANRCGLPMEPLDLTVIIPTYNERDNVALLLWLLHRHLAGSDLAWEAIIVDDASPDGTGAAVEALQKAAQEPGATELARKLGSNLRLIKRSGKLGLGSAYAAGVQQVRGRHVGLGLLVRPFCLWTAPVCFWCRHKASGWC